MKYWYSFENNFLLKKYLNISLFKFSKIFKGTHIKFKKMGQVYEGHDIEVFFDDSCGLQYDGEAVEKTYHYSAHK